jgi:hypothetical protein
MTEMLVLLLFTANDWATGAQFIDSRKNLQVDGILGNIRHKSIVLH